MVDTLKALYIAATIDPCIIQSAIAAALKLKQNITEIRYAKGKV